VDEGEPISLTRLELSLNCNDAAGLANDSQCHTIATKIMAMIARLQTCRDTVHKGALFSRSDGKSGVCTFNIDVTFEQ
jgi:hypothetical protein